MSLILKKEIRLFKDLGTVIKTKKGNEYYFFPHWLKKGDDKNQYDIINPEKMPDDLKEYLENARK